VTQLPGDSQRGGDDARHCCSPTSRRNA
jgi:hypothetical protein